MIADADTLFAGYVPRSGVTSIHPRAIRFEGPGRRTAPAGAPKWEGRANDFPMAWPEGRVNAGGRK